MNTQLIGKFGEDQASDYLKKCGYLILQRNFRCKMGEIDIIAVKDGCTVFVEVKTRKSESYGYAKEYVDYKKQKKVKKTGVYFLGSDDAYMRFDVIEVYYNNSGKVDIEHIENAF